METTGLNMVDKSKFFEKGVPNSTSSVFIKRDLFDMDETKSFWTKDVKLIEQYTRLIDNSYAEELNFSDSYKKIDTEDLGSFFYIGTHNSEVYGGLRLSISYPELGNLLPAEKEGIRYKDIFKEFDLTNHRYCEITRFAINKDFRNIRPLYVKFFKECRELMTENNVRYLISLATSSRHRMYNALMKENFIIHGEKDVDVYVSDRYANLSFAERTVTGIYENPDYNKSWER